MVLLKMNAGLLVGTIIFTIFTISNFMHSQQWVAKNSGASAHYEAPGETFTNIPSSTCA